MPKRSLESQIAILLHAEAFVKKKLRGDASGHDWFHIERVRHLAIRLAQQEGLDPFLPELIAIMHEVTDRKIAGRGNEKRAMHGLIVWLKRHGLTPSEIEEIAYVISHQSYSASGIRGEKLSSHVGQVVQDADRLDAIGAIGIARCFAYNGQHGNPMHDPNILPRQNLDAATYQQDKDTSINHFYEKLLKLKNLMNTESAQRIAAARHLFMEEFLRQFYAEWDSRD